MTRTSSTKPSGTALTTAQHNVLEALKSRYPDGLSRTELVAQCGHTATTRVGELRRLGWDIPAREQQAGEGLYRLASLVQGHPDDTLAGCIIRLGSQVGWTARTHQEAQGGRYSPEVLERAEQAALSAYQAALARSENLAKGQVGIDYGEGPSKHAAVLLRHPEGEPVRILAHMGEEELARGQAIITDVEEEFEHEPWYGDVYAENEDE